MLSQAKDNTIVDHQALFNATVPDIIHVNYQPPYEKGEIISIAPNDFAKQCGMKQWIETTLIHPKTKFSYGKEEFPGQTISQSKLLHLIKQSTSHSSHLVIAYMSKSLGFGVYTDAAISKNDVVALYAGLEISAENNHKPNESDYIYGIEDGNQKEIGVVDAKYYGNIARFFQHFPQAADRISAPQMIDKNYVFQDSETLASVSTANLLSVPYRYNNHALIAVIALRDIKPNEWLGMDYGTFWWNKYKHPLLIDHDGRVIPETKYHITKWICNTTIENKVYIGFELDKEQINQYQTMPIKTSFDFLGYAGTVSITPDDFSKAYQSTPTTSPYIFIKEPSDVTFTKHPKNNKKECKITPKLMSGFFLSKEEQIKRELLRIFDISALNCQYYENKNTAVLTHKDQKIINDIAHYLKNNNMVIQSGRHQKTKAPMLYIIEPSLNVLNNIPPFKSDKLETDIKQELKI